MGTVFVYTPVPLIYDNIHDNIKWPGYAVQMLNPVSRVGIYQCV